MKVASIDPELLSAAQKTSEYTGRSVEEIIAEWIGLGLDKPDGRKGFAYFKVPPGTPKVSADDIKALMANDGIPS